MYDIIMTERFDFHIAQMGEVRVCLLKANFYGVSRIACNV